MSVRIMNTENFATLRRDCGYYVDKTGFLERFLCAPSDASLFTRPRRFGKTLFMSMLAEFFDITKDSRKLFDGLRIAENENLCRERMNGYPVIFLTLKDVQKPTFERTIDRIHVLIRRLCNQHSYLLNSENVYEDDKNYIKQYMGEKVDEDILGLSLEVITRSMSCYYGKPAVLLIDEYDVPAAKAAENGFYDEMILFMRGFLSCALKTNPNLKFGILTGALPVANEGIFTGLNNIDCFDIATCRYADAFGFTQDEVDKLLVDAELEERRDTLREWYDGYHFGDRSDIYCPWSIMKYIADVQGVPKEKPKAYWAETSGNELTRGFPGRIPPTVQDDMVSLTEGKTIAAEINTALNHNRIYTEEDNFWTLLYLTGYLTPSSDIADCVVSPGSGQTVLAVPNRDVKTVFQSEIKSWFKSMLPKTRQQDFFDLFWKGDAQNLEKMLGTMLLTSSSVQDYKYREHFYHALLLGLFQLMYPVTSNLEAGKSFFDLTVRDTRNMCAAVIEVKRADSEDELEDNVEKALQQIEERQYDIDLKADGCTRIFHWGMAFFRKTCRMGVRRGSV